MKTNPKKLKLDSLLIAISFLILGIAILDASFLSGSQVLAFIGLGITFWGALFLLITPQKHVEGSFLVTSTLPAYMTIDRMLKDLESKNEAYNIPSYTREDVNLPEHLKGLKEMVTFIPEQNSTGLAEIEDIAKGKFLIKNPKGLLITPPGIGILDKIEQKHNIDLTKIPFSELNETLPNLLSDLYLTKEIKMTTNENEATIEINDSLYKNLYNQEYNLKSITLLGCPLVSAAACAIAKSTSKPTMIQKIETTPNGKTITATFKIVQS
jgi:hypothetical protein